MASFRKCLSAMVSVSKSHPQFLLSRTLGKRLKSVRQYSNGAYEGDGKTHAVLLNDESTALMINGYSELGFSLNNGVKVLGPMAIFPNCVLSWNVGDIVDINEEALSLFLLLEPKLDILILGVPAFNKTNRAALNSIAQLVRKFKIQVEVMPTEIACPTFNFLHAEQRFVGAGIIPPVQVLAGDTEAMTGANTVGYVNREEFR